MNLYDPSAEQPTYKKSLIDALTGTDAPALMYGNNALPAVETQKVEQPAGSALGAPVSAAASALTQDFSRLAGYDQGKFNDPNKQSAKYVIGRTLSAFDPTKGITSGVLAGLNSLGYGTFSGNGDKLSLSGLTDAGRGAGLTGNYSGADFIQGFKGGNGKWGYADPAAEAAQGAQAPAASRMFAGSAISPMLQSNAGQNIQTALANIGSLNQSNLLQQLIAALQGGG